MSLPKEEAWFPAKRYGYGWGFPVRRQGWLALGLYVFSLLIDALIFSKSDPTLFAVFAGASTVIILVVFVWKGEAPKWRWGGDE